MRVTMHTPDRRGYLTTLEVLPQVGNEVRLLDDDGECETFRVASVRHLIRAGADYTAGAQIIEVQLTEPSS